MERGNLITLSFLFGESHLGRRENFMRKATCGERVLALAAILGLGLSVVGCGAVSPQREVPMQRIADADTRSEHEDLAAWYEQEARTAEERVGYHRRMQQIYEARRDRPALGKLQMEPYVDYDPGTNAQWDAFVEACESRVRGAQQAAEDYLTLAKIHRQMAAAAKR